MSTTSPFALTPEITALVAGAFDSGNVLLLAAVDKDRKPVLSFRGSTSVFSDTQLSFWVRNTAGGTIEAIKDNPHVALMYRSQSVPLLRFIGQAQIVDSPAERDRAYDLAPEKERASDPERKGHAVIVDLDEVKGVLGFGASGPIFCHLARS
jgi:hypothetical protein